MVNNEEFVIKVSDDISKFEHLINSYMCEMIEELKKGNCTGMVGQRMVFCMKKLRQKVNIF